MSDQRIDVFLRLRPTPKSVGIYAIDSGNRISFDVPKDERGGLINNTKEHFEFLFSSIFDTSTKQEDVFEQVARPILQGSVFHNLEAEMFQRSRGLQRNHICIRANWLWQDVYDYWWS
jgi:hypothetical protein